MPIRYPRFLNRLYALFLGYYWLPCPICGRMYGGHEAAQEGLLDSFHTGRCVCWRCGDEAARRNEANGFFRPRGFIVR